MRELAEDLAAPARAAEEVGDVLFAAVNVARRVGAGSPWVMPRKIGARPAGSTMTSSVTKAEIR